MVTVIGNRPNRLMTVAGLPSGGHRHGDAAVVPLDQAADLLVAAGAAFAGGGVLADFLDRAQAERLDRLDDGGFRHPEAAADELLRATGGAALAGGRGVEPVHE